MKKLLTFLIFTAFVRIGFGQVKGLIVDENGNPIPGVNLLLPSKGTGTVTDIEGKFTLSADPGDSLTISFVGYESRKELIKDANQSLNIKLQPVSFDLNEMIVLGYNNKTKTEISSAVTVLNEQKLNDTPSDDIAGLIQGKVPGVQVISSSGAPGSGSEIRIRGVSTIKPGSAEPLYVVDGIIGGSFDPNDVATLTVLKDAGATGMYGARANKGVIIVTTKAAKSGKPVFELKTSLGYDVANQGKVQMMNGSEFYDLSSEMYRDMDNHLIDKIKFYADYPKTLRSINHDWVGQAFTPAPLQKYYLSASGSANKLGYFISGAYFKEKGTFRKTGYEKINLRANTDYTFNSHVTLKNNINLTASKGTSYDYMDMYYTYLGIPWDNPFNSDGSARFIDGTIAKKLPDGSGWWSRDPINPFHNIDNSDNSYKGVGADYDLVLNVDIFKWLSFSSSNRIGFSTSKGHNFYSPAVAGTYYKKGYISEDQSMWFSGISTNLFHFRKTFGEHSLDGLAGVEFEEGYSESLGLSGTGLPLGFNVPSVASAEYKINGTHTTEMFRSFISQANYNFRGTYFLTGSYRVDATSNFPSNNRIAKFPTISGSVLLNKLPFLEDAEIIDMLKLRTSYGITGDPDIGASRYLGLFALSTQYNGKPAATPYQLANPDLTWERTKQFDLGIDLEMARKVTLNIDLYNNLTTDLIILAAQPLSQGFESRYENSGSVVNKGFEIGLSTENIRTRDLKFTTDFNFAMNSNELTGIKSPITTTVGGVTQIYRNGAELYTFYLPKWLGVDPQTGGPLWEKITKDANGKILTREATSNYSEADPQEVGSALPDFTGGVSATLQYRNFTLYATGAYQYGNDVYNATRIFMDNDGHEPYYNNMKPDPDWKRWEKPGDIATHPSMQNNSLSKETSSRYLEKGSFFKLRTVSIQYDLPVSFTSRMKLNEVTLAFTGNNLYVFTKFWGQDPEITLNKESWSMPGVCDFKYPNSTQYMFSLNVKF
jgi:TonB-linked SusC/RagA family outer membrane protein